MTDKIAIAAKIAGDWWAERLMQGDKEMFAKEVAARVETALRSGATRVYLECDYDPQGILLEAVQAIGLKCQGFMFSADGILPRKHALDVRVDTIKPKEGYGNWREAIQVPVPGEGGGEA